MEPTRPDLLLNKTFFFFFYLGHHCESRRTGENTAEGTSEKVLFYSVRCFCYLCPAEGLASLSGYRSHPALQCLRPHTVWKEKTSLSRRKTAYLALNSQPPCSDSASCWLPARTDALIGGELSFLLFFSPTGEREILVHFVAISAKNRFNFSSEKKSFDCSTL